MPVTTIQVVHGFAVASAVFRPLLHELTSDSVRASLIRYPSVGLGLDEIVSSLAERLRADPPDAIVAHSLGGFATWLAVAVSEWRGPIVLLAPPLTVIPCTRLIPSFLRWPFAPLLDHRRLTSDVRFSLPELDGCAIKTIAGRFDFSVPLSCTRHPEVDDATVLIHTHNSMLFASEVARFCLDWIDQHVSSSDSAGVLVATNQSS
ncbi:MAG: alpha/beta fold hydrolase [Planctomycetota bacterium]